jgi:G6PDH family F420-dependent oxidoreductase
MRDFKLGVDLGENYREPRQFVECAVLADKLEFDSVWFGDHFMPSFHGGRQSAFVWTLMAACLQATERIRVGPIVTSPIGGRYHPAIIAQAAATLDNMFPGRFLLGVGSGEAVNEARFFEGVGMSWPPSQDRIERLVEGVELMRELWNRPSFFDFKGRFFEMMDVYLYTKPKMRIPIYFSAMGPRAAAYAGRVGDHLITISSPERCRDVIFPKFEEAARIAGKQPNEMEKLVPVLFMIGNRDANLTLLRSGRASLLAKGFYDEPDPRRVELSTATLSNAVLQEHFHLCDSIEDLVNIMEHYVAVGVNHLLLGTGASPELIEHVAERILPSFR